MLTTKAEIHRAGYGAVTIVLGAMACSSGTQDSAANIQGSGAQAGSNSTAGDSSALQAGAGGKSNGSVAPGPSQPERIVSGVVVTNLIVRDGYVYYGDNTEDNEQQSTWGHLNKVPIAGGTPIVLARAELPSSGSLATIYPAGLVADASNVYWTDFGSSGRLVKTPVRDGASTTLWSDATCNPWGPVALEGDTVYWFSRCAQTGAALLALPVAGGAATEIGSGTTMTWTPGPLGSNLDFRSLAVGNGKAFWTNPTGTVVSLVLEGGAQPTVLSSQFEVSGPSNIVVSKDRVYFTLNDYKLQNRGAVWAMNLDGTDATAIAKNQNIEVDTALALDDMRVYWAVNDAISSASLTGGDVATVAASLANPRALAVDDCCVYWTDDAGGILRVSKTAK